MSILQKLTEGVINRDMRKEGAALLDKWERTGLLEGMGGDVSRNNMARLLENQAKELLREAASTMAGGDVEGFAAVAFPIVRRVFGSLIANELVSVQPMSLPSGLIFFLDFTFGGTGNAPASSDRLGFGTATSLYGGNKVAAEITGGVDLAGNVGTNAGQFYNLTNGYSSPTGSTQLDGITSLFSGTYLNLSTYGGDDAGFGGAGSMTTVQNNFVNEILQYDPDLVSGSTVFCIQKGGLPSDFAKEDLVSLTVGEGSNASYQLRRLTQLSRSVGGTANSAVGDVFVVFAATASSDTGAANTLAGETTWDNSYVMTDAFAPGNATGSVVGQTAWGLENNTEIPEINLKVDSVSVTAVTKKLKAKWTPELGQDLNAYHNLDAEVELTSILSEQIALEIDREIVEDLVRGATASTYWWSRSPGLFVERDTGAEVGASAKAPDFTGTVSEWYETLLETVNDVSAQIHRKTLRGGANFLVTSPEVASILEMTSGFRANVTVDDNKGVAGTQNVGSINKRFEVYIDPYFPRNLLLIGRKGSSFLESGYVYAPYVPLQVTPTIFGTEDFVPRKGVMTRYAKKMVRPDMYGLVIVRGLLGETGG